MPTPAKISIPALAVAAILALPSTPPLHAETQLHESGLRVADGLDTVLANCTVCHSAKIIAQNHMSRERWDKTLNWMREQQGMQELAPNDRKIILDYLAENQGVGKTDGSAVQSVRAAPFKMYEYDYRPNPLFVE